MLPPTDFRTTLICFGVLIAAMVVSAPALIAGGDGTHQSLDRSIMDRIENATDPTTLRTNHLRPDTYTPSIQQAYYESTPARTNNRLQRFSEQEVRQAQAIAPVQPETATETEQASLESFLDRERKTQQSNPKTTESALDLVTRISLNLVIVLSIALVVIVVLKQRHNGPGNARADSQLGFHVTETLPLKNGASLQIVEYEGNRFLVALDGNGIRSVNAIQQSFNEAMEETRYSEPNQDLAATQSRNPIEDTADIDAKLVKLLIKNAKKAA